MAEQAGPLAREAAGLPGWDMTREARFSALIDVSVSGWMTPAESRELSALKKARDKALPAGEAGSQAWR